MIPAARAGYRLKAEGRTLEALEAFRDAARLEPGAAAHRLEAGIALLGLRRWAEAGEALAAAAHLDPADPGLRHNLGVALRHQGRLEEARGAFAAALELDAGFAPAWSALAAVAAEQGAQEEAWALRRRAEAALGDRAPSVLLEAAVNYHGGLSREEVFRRHLAWGRWIEGQVEPLPPVPPEPRAGRPLRVGYVSPDLRRHSCAAFLEPLWEHHDPARVEVHAYALSPGEDATTARLRRLAHRWRDCAALAPEAVAQAIRADRIDLLVDLAGHSHGRQLLVFARKPAPVQVAWLGYPATTGLSRMDARLTDALADPPGAEAWHTERLVRLPRFLCYRPEPDAPDPGPPPMLQRGACTFASFNNPSKLAPAVVALWSRLLLRVPGARLLLKASPFADPGTRARWVRAFEAHGVAAQALDFRPFEADTADHLARYREADLALDPFPYNGTTTTCEALWMGVPVLSIAGDRHAARTGLSLLHAVGRPDWVAPDPEAWLDLAASLAGDPARLAAARADLRAAVARSPLCDGRAFAASVEEAFLDLAGAREAGG
ncbi:MAG: tetratricopeptide repeat protein [Holophagaceae bacterium]